MTNLRIRIRRCDQVLSKHRVLEVRDVAAADGQITGPRRSRRLGRSQKSEVSRQAGGRKGAGNGSEWKDFTANANAGSAACQDVLCTATGKIAACGAVQPQSQFADSQQLPSAVPVGCCACEASPAKSEDAESGMCPACDAVPAGACNAATGCITRPLSNSNTAIRARTRITTTSLRPPNRHRKSLFARSPGSGPESRL